jgi:competence protein ComEC
MIAILMSPLIPWLVLGALLTTAVALANRRLGLLAGLVFLALLLGAGRALLAPTVELPTGLAGQTVALSGTVDDDPVERKGNHRLTVRLDHVLGGAGQTTSRLRIQATVYGPTPVHYGDLVVLSGEVITPPRFDQFDYRTYLAGQGIAGVMPSARLVRVTSHPGDPIHTILYAVRHALIDTVDRALPEPQAALLLGVVFGYRAALPTALEQQMIASGLVHIVVASGLNVALLARLVQQALGRTWPRGAAVTALTAIIGYALLSGASPAALRATLMGGLVILAGMIHRQSHVFVALALAAGVLLGIKPSLVRDVGFQLSFAATLGIVIWADPLTTLLRWLPGPLREALAATLAAQAMTWPLLLAEVHRLSLIAPLSNLLVVPLVPFMMVAGAIGATAGCVLPLAGWLPLQAAGAVASWFQGVIEVTGSLPLAAITTPYFPTRWLAAAAVLNTGVLATIKLRRFFWRRKVWLALGAAALFAVGVLVVEPDGRVHVYALDVGTGSAVLVRTSNGHQLLIDAGPDADRLTQALGRALPPTARTIDVWLITGGRRTNVGAAAAILARFEIKRLVVADPEPWSATLRALVQQAQAAGIPVVRPNGSLAVDGVNLSLAGDERSWLIRTRQSALVLVPPQTRWQSLPPDIDGAIFTSGGPLEWHGPAQGFSVIQVSTSSRDGLPVRATLQALVGAPLYRTDRSGLVELVETASRFAPAR